MIYYEAYRLTPKNILFVTKKIIGNRKKVSVFAKLSQAYLTRYGWVRLTQTPTGDMEVHVHRAKDVDFSYLERYANKSSHGYFGWAN